MINRKMIIGVCWLLMLVLSMIPISAQANDRLYFNSNGDLWVATSDNLTNPHQLTEWGYNGGPILSPDGSRFAYVSVASEAVELSSDPNSEQGYLLYVGTPPTNIWIMETANEDFERVADQRTGFPIRRGIPSWSPDGSELAWVEYSDSTLPQLVVYNFDTNSSRVVADSLNLGFQDAGIRVPPVKWGPSGIARLFFTFVESGQAQQILEVINPANNHVSQFVLYSSATPFAQDESVPIDFVWVEHNARAMIAIMTNTGTWSLLDPSNGSQFELPEAPSLVARNGNGARITPTFVEQEPSWRIAWQTEATDGTELEEVFFSTRLMDAPALSPDGRVVATNSSGSAFYTYIDSTLDADIITMPDPEFIAYAEPHSVAWTPMRWVTNVDTGVEIPTPAVPNTGGNLDCEPVVELTIGDLVTVNPGPPNNLRANPGVNSAFIGSFYPGDVLGIADGPVCIDGLRWWFAAGEGGFGGWTAEGSVDGEAWLLVISSPFVNQCPLPPRLSRGAIGVVLDGDPNALRDGPDANGTQVIGHIPAGATFTVLGDSLCGTDGRRWFPVEYNGTMGWTAEGEGNTYWLVPASF